MFHALTAAPTVKSVGITITEPGHVTLYPLVVTGDGLPSLEVLKAIRHKLLEDDVRPLTDIVTVTQPTIVYQPISVTLVVKEGPDVTVLVNKARVALANYALQRHKVGAGLYKSGIYQAAQVPGVEHVIINAPLTDIDPGIGGAVYVPSITVAHEIIYHDANLLEQ
jgi:phage-related baseplate assembly protein